MTKRDLSQYRVTSDTPITDVNLDEEVVVVPDGRRLTEELAEEIADAVVARRHPNLVAGRKSLSRSSGHSPRLNVRLPEDAWEGLQAIAAEQHETVSVLAREALVAYVDAWATGRANAG